MVQWNLQNKWKSLFRFQFIYGDFNKNKKQKQCYTENEEKKQGKIDEKTNCSDVWTWTWHACVRFFFLLLFLTFRVLLWSFGVVEFYCNLFYHKHERGEVHRKLFISWTYLNWSHLHCIPWPNTGIATKTKSKISQTVSVSVAVCVEWKIKRKNKNKNQKKMAHWTFYHLYVIYICRFLDWIDWISMPFR